MPKRKAKAVIEEEESELSPLPDESLVNGGDAVNGSKKRKIKQETGEAEGEKTVARPKRARNTKVIVEEDDEDDEEGEKAETSPKRKSKIKEEAEEKDDEGETKSKPKPARKAKVKTEVKAEEDSDAESKPKPKTKRKTKEEKGAEMIPLAARTAGHKLFIGAHVSAAGGVPNAVVNSTHIGANAFALFLKSQRKWANPDLTTEHAEGFCANCKLQSYEQGKHVVPHGSYLVNLAHTDKARTEQAYTSYLDDLKRCERLGIKLYNIHPGNTVSNDRQEAIAHLAKNINSAHKETSTVITLLENMAAGGNVLGSTFEDLRDIIELVDNKERIGVCIDTCHAFASGYDLRTEETFHATMQKFSDIVGFKYLKALHINDSKAPLSSHRDLHANIGTGFLGLRAFHHLVNDTRFIGLPLILETPIEVTDDEGNEVKDEKGKVKEDRGIWAREIKMLEGLVGMDIEGEAFREMEGKLARKGEKERERVLGEVERKREKDAKKGTKKGKGKAKGKKGESEGEASEED